MDIKDQTETIERRAPRDKALGAVEQHRFESTDFQQATERVARDVVILDDCDKTVASVISHVRRILRGEETRRYCSLVQERTLWYRRAIRLNRCQGRQRDALIPPSIRLRASAAGSHDGASVSYTHLRAHEA